MFLEHGFGKLGVAKNFGEKTASDIFAGVNRNYRGTAIGMLQIMMTAADTDDLETEPLQGCNKFAT